MPEIRVPTQKRSIEKRNKILENGFNLMCENGYFNTSTPDIAKAAGVSTGIIYQYFKDKKDIFIEGVKNYAESIMFPMIDILENENIKIDNLDNVIKSMINIFIQNHTISKKAHEELMAMSHLDEDVSDIFKNSEIKMTEKIVKILENNNIYLKNAKEKIHIIVGIIDNFCHEIVYHKHNSINYEVMQNEVINLIKNIIC